jgi:hypothetical protein
MADPESEFVRALASGVVATLRSQGIETRGMTIGAPEAPKKPEPARVTAWQAARPRTRSLGRRLTAEEGPLVQPPIRLDQELFAPFRRPW